MALCADDRVVVTKGEQALSNKLISLYGLRPCSHKEAESRIFTHALHAEKQKMKFLLIKAYDKDILVVAVSVFATLQEPGLELIWIETWTRPVNQVVANS